MSPDPLALIWRSADVQAPVFTGEELARWPAETLELLTGLGVVREGKTADHVECTACGQQHIEKVMRISYPGGRVRFFIACPEHGRVEVERDHLLQWTISFDPICRSLGIELGVETAPEEVIPSRLWKIGRTALAKRSRAVWVGRGLGWDDADQLAGFLPSGRSPVLFVMGTAHRPGLVELPPESVVEIAQVMSLSDGRFRLDRASIEDQLSHVPVVRKKRLPKRSTRTATMESLKRILQQHIRGARDHAEDLLKKDKPAELLARPTLELLAREVGVSTSTVSRALRDGSDKELIILWQAATDLDQVLRYRRR